MRWSKGADGGGLESEEEKNKTNRKEDKKTKD